MEVLDNYLSIVIFAVAIVSINVTVSHEHNIILVPLNCSSSFSCPDENLSCTAWTVNEIPINGIHYYSQFDNIFVFQSGTHNITKKVKNRYFSLAASNDLIVWGQGNVTIRCAAGFSVLLTTAVHIAISNIHFLDCECKVISSKTPPYLIYLKFTNLKFSNSSLILEKAKDLVIKGQGTQNVTVTCLNSSLFLDIYPHGTLKLFDMQIQNCSSIKFHSRSMNTTIQIFHSRFTNSCLEYKADLTKSDSHVAQLTIKKTNFEWCSCGPIRLFSKPKIHMNITLDEVNAIDNSLPFLKSESGVHVIVTGHNNFYRNKDFIMQLEGCEIVFTRARVEFLNGTVNASTVHGTPIHARQSKIIFEDSSVLFRHNQGPLCGGIAGERTLISFKDNVTVIFHNNSGLNGGALSLYTESRLQFNASQSNITLHFQNNTAQIGGAIYVEDSGYKDIESVFKLQGEPGNVKLVFGDNNVASFSGNQIYGGWIDWFVNKTASTIPENQTDMVNTFIEFENENYTQVTSHPIRICLCINGNINCSITNHNMTIYGKALSLDLVGVGQRYTPVITHVEASLLHESKSIIHQSNNMDSRLTSLQSACTKISYKISYKIESQSDEEMITLKPFLPYLYYNSNSRNLLTDGIVDDLFTQLTIKLKIHQCPWGFFELANGSCKCQLSIHRFGLSCNMDNYTIYRSKQQWIGVVYDHSRREEYPGVIAHQHCPFDYCRSDDESLSIRLENRDEQCAFNREGILCGGCKENLSRVFGTSNCKECSNKYTLLIIFSWLISGFILVACLMLLNLTVSVGTINGLTFYVNIIRAQHTTFFTPEISNTLLSKFIAWLNLDIGTEMCFYDGLDSYAITWLQFFYPLYIWLIAAILIILSRFSSHISKVCGKNAVQVLATLFLISYARLLRLMIEVFSFTTITYPDGYKKTVWLVDGNYDFFKGKHIPLVLVTILFVLLSLPYTFILLTIQFLYKVSHYRVLFWVRRLKPLFDAYTGPYKSCHRYWTGLLLVARIVLLITFSVNHSNNRSINLLAIVTVSILLLGWLSSANWVYESPLNNFLEILFLANLGLISAAVSFNIFNGNYSPAAIYLSTSIAFVVFIFIILYHVHRQLVLTKLGSKLTVKVLRAIPLKRASKANETDDTVEFSDMIPSVSSHTDVSSTMVDLDQSAKPMYNSYNSHELKEPLLDDD